MHKKLFNIRGEKIAGASFTDKANDIPQILFIHGGSKSSENLYYLAELLFAKGISSILFDHSGHGKSSGKIFQSSLKKRVNEAKEVVLQSKMTEPISICAFSMGGYVALKLLEEYEVENLYLFCPAVYDKKAYDKFFGDEFTQIIRQPESYKNTDVLKNLQKFKCLRRNRTIDF